MDDVDAGFGILLGSTRVGGELLNPSLPRMGGADPALGGVALVILPWQADNKRRRG